MIIPPKMQGFIYFDEQMSWTFTCSYSTKYDVTDELAIATSVSEQNFEATGAFDVDLSFYQSDDFQEVAQDEPFMIGKPVNFGSKYLIHISSHVTIPPSRVFVSKYLLIIATILLARQKSVIYSSDTLMQMHFSYPISKPSVVTPVPHLVFNHTLLNSTRLGGSQNEVENLIQKVWLCLVIMGLNITLRSHFFNHVT